MDYKLTPVAQLQEDDCVDLESTEYWTDGQR
jgi:hypothetical protein